MRRLLNTLYVLTPDVYLSLEGETILLKRGDELVNRLPLLNFESIVKFGFMGVSPALMGYCAKNNVPINFLTSSGRFLARVVGEYRGNVTLRRQQYRIADDKHASTLIAKNFIRGKVYNARGVVNRAIRDHALRVDVEYLQLKSNHLKLALNELNMCADLDSIRGIEGRAAVDYFSTINMMILQQKGDFVFENRSKRPPTDNMNAILSFLYTVLTNECASALQTVGLDPYVGFLHRDRPGRVSLALDLMEELRPYLVDRLTLTLINKRQIERTDFVHRLDGAVLLTDVGKKKVLTAWQNMKQEQIQHPFLQEKIHKGLLPYAQAQLLARFIRNDLDQYPPFFMR